MTLMALIADDLTGANDSGVQLVRRGLTASVFFAGQPVREGADVLVVDTDSRALPAREAYAAARRAAERLAAARPAVLYKKVDSTLRGNLGAEIDAVMDVFGFPLAVIAPAFPRIGRTTEGGVQYLHGVPVSETEIGRDPRAPVRTARIADLLAEQSVRRVGLLPLADVREGRTGERLRTLREQGVRMVVCDAVVESDLVAVARASRALGEPVLYVGSAGLADVLPSALGVAPGGAPEARGAVAGQGGPAAGATGAGPGAPAAPAPTGPVLLVVGSVSGVSRTQLEKALAAPGIRGVEVRTERLFGADAAAEEERCVREGAAALEAGSDLALFSAVADDAVARTQALGREQGLSPVQTSERVAAALGRIAGRICRAAPVGALALTGGDTAQAVCREVGATGIDLVREVEPGIPLGRLVGERPYLAVTKAGAFGTPEALRLAIENLKEAMGR